MPHPRSKRWGSGSICFQCALNGTFCGGHVPFLFNRRFTYYKDQIRELIQGLHEGSVEIAEVQEHLGRSQLLFAQQLNNIINLFLQGAVTLKRVEEIVREIKKVFPDSDFSDLASSSLAMEVRTRRLPAACSARVSQSRRSLGARYGWRRRTRLTRRSL